MSVNVGAATSALGQPRTGRPAAGSRSGADTAAGSRTTGRGHGGVPRDHARSTAGRTGGQETVGTPFAGGATGAAEYSLTGPSASSVSYAGPK